MLTMMTNGDGRKESAHRRISLLATLLAQEARVARAEAALDAAKRRLAVLQARFGRLGRPVAAIAAACMEEVMGAPTAVMEARDGTTMRARILHRLAKSPGEVFTPATLGPAVGAGSRDSVRNTLLVLASRGQIEKIGPGQYRARRAE